MNETIRAHLLDIFQYRHRAIVDAWYRAIVYPSLPPSKGAAVRTQLSTLVDQITALLLNDPFDHQAARAIGAELIRLGYLEPETLGDTHNVLGREFVLGLSTDDIAALYPRLMALLGELTTGFLYYARDTLRTEQEQIHNALLAERTRLEEALHAREACLRAVITNIPVVLFAINRAGICTLAEGKGLELMGLTSHDVIGRSILAMSLGNLQILNNIHRAISGDTFATRVEVDQRVYQTNYGPLRDRHGHIQGVIGVAIDITDHTHAEADLAHAQRQLAEWMQAQPGRVAPEGHKSAG